MPNKLDNKTVNILLKKKGYKLLSPYSNCASKHDIKCLKCKTILHTTPTGILHQHQGCNVCYQNSRKIPKANIVNKLRKSNILIKSSFRILDDWVKLKCCSCGNQWEAQLQGIYSNKYGCPKCAIDKRKWKKHKVIALLRKAGLELVDQERRVRCEGKNTKLFVKYRCKKCNDTNWATLRKGISCFTCSSSIFEKKVIKAFKSIIKKKYKKVRFIKQKVFKGLKSANGGKLRFDCVAFTARKVICIEAQGDQHTNENNYYHLLAQCGRKKSWEHQCKNDKIKRKFCKKNGYKLIEIFERCKDVKSKIKEWLK